jgi:hypothetical protein
MATGMTADISAHTQNIFDAGHRFEALARSIAEDIVKEDLYPVTGSANKFSASFDGLTLCETIAFEHKTLNDELRVAIPANDLPLMYRVQMEQQLMVSGAEKCLFMASKWNDNDELIEELHCWYESDTKLQNQIVDGWAQFQSDMDSYIPIIHVEAPKAEAIIDLPAVIVQVRGELTLCNIADMRPIFDKFLTEATVNLVTDGDFAQAEAESKIGRDAARRCIATAKGVIDQTATISEVTRELEQYAAKFNALALSQEKAVKTQKEARKLAIMSAAKGAFAGHIAGLELEIKPIRLDTVQPNFPEAMKNKRLLSAIQDAVDSELARVKIEADKVAKKIRFNLVIVNQHIGLNFLFSDLQQIIDKECEDFILLVNIRVYAHKKAEDVRIEDQRLQIVADEKRKAEARQDKKLEDERAKIRAEEQIKVNEKAIADRAEFDAQCLRNKKELQDLIELAESRAKPSEQFIKPGSVFKRPSGEMLINDMAIFYDVSELVICEWLQEIDFAAYVEAA